MTPRQRAQAVSMALSGAVLAEIATAVAVDPDAVRAVLRENGVRARPVRKDETRIAAVDPAPGSRPPCAAAAAGRPVPPPSPGAVDGTEGKSGAANAAEARPASRAELVARVLALFREGRSYRDIAVAVGGSRSTVAGLVARARDRGEDLAQRDTTGLSAAIAEKRRRAAHRKDAEAVRRGQVAHVRQKPPGAEGWHQAEGPPPRTCQWIAGEPSPDDACKCGAPALSGRPYCEAHCKRAYVRPVGPVDPALRQRRAEKRGRLLAEMLESGGVR